MDKIDWNKLKVLYKVASVGSFSQAAKQFHISPSALSKMIKCFEIELGFKLFIRDQKGIQLTHEGTILFKEANKFSNRMKVVEDDLKNEVKSFKGALKIVSPSGISTMYISKFISNFTHQYPNIQLEIVSFDSISLSEKLSGHILIHPLIDDLTGYQQDLLITTELKMYASASYLKKYGTPSTIDDLNNHRLIAFSQNKDLYIDLNWHLKLGMPEGKKRSAVFEADASFGRCFLAYEGIGIITVPKQHPDIKKYELVEVLPYLKGPQCSYHLIIDEVLSDNPKVKVLSKFLMEKFAEL